MQPDYKNIVNFENGLNSDIITTLENSFEKAVAQTKDFAEQFRGRNILESCENVWNYLKNNVLYVADSVEHQKIILPARLIERAEKNIGADCKSFSLFAASILANLYPGAKICFRYVSFRSSKTPTHVYCVVKTNKGIIIVDAVWHSFNSQKDYTHKIDQIGRAHV